jgi:hypothetical protein
LPGLVEVGIIAYEEQRMDDASVAHCSWDERAETGREFDVFDGCSAVWVCVGQHLKASVLVIGLVLIQDSVEVRPLPGEDVGGQERSLEGHA